MVSPLIPDTGVLLQLHTHNKLQKCVLFSISILGMIKMLMIHSSKDKVFNHRNKILTSFSVFNVVFSFYLEFSV